MRRLSRCLLAAGVFGTLAPAAVWNTLAAGAPVPPEHDTIAGDDEAAERGGTPGGDRVHALFDLGRPDTGPFPSDVFTVEDPAHATGRRMNLPYPDCTVRVSDWGDLNVINTLDGFGLQTRLSMPVDGPIDVETATGKNVFLIDLGSRPTGRRLSEPPPSAFNTIEGAVAIQEAMELHEWGQQSGQSPEPWVRHLREAPLPGVYAKSLLVLFGRGDQNAINPGTAAILRAGSLVDVTVHTGTISHSARTRRFRGTRTTSSSCRPARTRWSARSPRERSARLPRSSRRAAR